MQTTSLMLLVLVMAAFALSRRRWHCLQGWQKLFGVIALVATVLMVLQPELIALGLLGDTAFFDMMVLALSLQMHWYVVQGGRILVTVLTRSLHWLGIPSPGLRLILAVLTIAIVNGVSVLRGLRTAFAVMMRLRWLNKPMHTNRRHPFRVQDSGLSDTGFAAGVDARRRLVILFL